MEQKPSISSIIFDSVVTVVCTAGAITSRSPFAKVAFAILAIGAGSTAIEEIEKRCASNEDVL